MFKKLVVHFDTADTITYDYDTGKVHSFNEIDPWGDVIISAAVVSNAPPAKRYLMWFNQGQLHREKGPALIGPGGRVEYWLEGKQVSEEAWELLTGNRDP